MSTDLVKIETTNEVAGYNSGLDTFAIKPSIVKLIQPTSKVDDVPPGVFYDTLDGTVLKEIKGIILTVSLQRDYYPAGSTDFSGPPLCKSLDGVKPWSGSEAVQASTCAQCPKSKWLNGKKPECSEAYKLLYLEEDTLLPKIVHFRRRGISAVKQFFQILNAKAISLRNKGQGSFDMKDFRVTIKAKKDGIAYVPMFVDVDLHGRDVNAEVELYAVRNLAVSEPDEVPQDFSSDEAIDIPFEQV